MHGLNVILILLVVTAAHAADITATLDSSDGTSGFSFRDSASMEMAKIDSDGNMVLKGGLRLDSDGAKNTMSETLIVDGKIGIATASLTHALNVTGTAEISAGLMVDTNTLFVNGSTNRIGISTSNPLGKFDVRGGRSFFTADSEQYAIGCRYSGACDFVYFGATGDPAAPDAAISNAGGNTLMLLKSNGNVGIGTSNPSETLEVAGGLKIGTTSAANDGTIRWTGTDFEGRKGGSWVSLSASGNPEYIKIVDEKPNNTTGGTFTTGDWRVRDLNTEYFDTGNNAAVAGNQITLNAGAYRFLVSAPGWGCNRHRIRLYNATDATVVAYGTSEYCNGDTAQTRSTASGQFTIGVSKAFQVHHRCTVTGTTYGFGVNAGLGVPEVYTTCEFWKIE